MQIIRMTDDIVTGVEPLTEGDTAIVDDRAPRIGSVLEGQHFMAPGAAALVVDGVVIQVAIGKYADEKPAPDTGKWIDTDRNVVPGYLYDSKKKKFSAPPIPRDIGGDVAAHSIKLKIGIVNATRTDGGDPYPETEEALEAVRNRYTDTLNELSAKSLSGEELSAGEKQIIGLIRAGNDFFKLVDAAADAIIGAGDAADPIETDGRWPELPSA